MSLITCTYTFIIRENHTAFVESIIYPFIYLFSFCCIYYTDVHIIKIRHELQLRRENLVSYFNTSFYHIDVLSTTERPRYSLFTPFVEHWFLLYKTLQNYEESFHKTIVLCPSVMKTGHPADKSLLLFFLSYLSLLKVLTKTR